MKTKLASIDSSIFSFFNVVTLQWKNQGGHLTTFGEHIKWVFIGKFTSRMRNPLSSGILCQKFEGSRTVFRSCHPFITQIILLTKYTQPSNDLLSLGIIIGIIMFIEIPCVHFFYQLLQITWTRPHPEQVGVMYLYNDLFPYPKPRTHPR